MPTLKMVEGERRNLPDCAVAFSTTSNPNVIYEKKTKVPLQGTLDIKTPFKTRITSSQDDIELLDKASIKVVDESETLNPNDVKNLVSFETTVTDSSVTVFRGISKSDKINSKFICDAIVPIQYNIKAAVAGAGSVEIQNIESKNVTITTKEGNITCKTIKCETLNLSSTSGDISFPSVVHGNINIKTQDGNVSGIRLQGTHIDIETNRGIIDLSSIYAETSVFKSVSGEMNLDNFHGNGTVQLKDGTVKITGLDGSLRGDVESGEITVQVSRLNGLYLNNKNGNIEVKVPTHLQSRVEIEAKEIDIEKRLQVQGKFKKSDRGRTFTGVLGAGNGPIVIIFAPKGLVRISIQDWLSSMGGMIPEFGPSEEFK
uniref:DUF4097 domain-containing protein n=1 Tax=Strigamia maritima TaxID=126957 RepID=T1IZB0_STRMM